MFDPVVTDQPEESKQSVTSDDKPRATPDGQSLEDDTGQDKSWFSSWGVADIAKKVQQQVSTLSVTG